MTESMIWWIVLALGSFVAGLGVGSVVDWTRGAREREYTRGFNHGTNLERDLHVCDVKPAAEPAEGESQAGPPPATVGSKR